ncbi:MAG: HD domain-containing protein, partial [Firmicutes bacterium]|nr:HD domain-containing protein [Bacillota bacterium]
KESGEWESYEATTFRVDGDYSDNRHPDSVVFTKNIEEDLARRDFTINAMAYSEKAGLIDPFGGEEDLREGMIRCVGDPETRFNEDALRIMRGVRFSSVLGFSPEEETSSAIIRQKRLLDNIAAERVRVELDKLLCGRDAGRVLREYREVIAQIIPEIRQTFDFDQQTPYHAYDVWEHTVRAVENVEAEPTLRLAALFHDIGKPETFIVKDDRGHFYRHERVSEEYARIIMRRLKYDNDTRKTVCSLIEKHGTVFRHSQKQVRRLLRDLGEEKLRMLIKLEKADVKSQAPEYIDERLELIDDFSRLVDEVIESAQCFAMKDLAIDGKDILQMGIKQGPDVGTVLKAVFDKVIEGELENDRAALMAEAERIAGENKENE